MRKLSMRGVPVDFARFLNEEGDRPALGNAKMNARGDIINASGDVVTSRADISAEYHRSHTRSVRQASIKDLQGEIFQTPGDAVKDLTEKFKIAERAKAAAAEEKFGAKSRKISDKD